MSDAQSKITPCGCADAGCPVHRTVSQCVLASVVTFYRIDMEDITGTPFCEACATDALESGLFTDDTDEEVNE